MSKNIGFLLPKLEHNPFHNAIVSCIRNLEKQNTYGETILFCSSCSRTDTGDIPIMHLLHAKFFDGSLVLFDLPSLILSKSFTNLKNKYFYVFQTMWSETNKYSLLKNLIADPELDIIVSDKHLYNIYDICWKKPKDIMEIHNYEKLFSII